MTHWHELEGVSLGRHWLKVCLTSSADDAWYLTRYDTARDAAVRVLYASAPNAEVQLEMWRKAMDIHHPHIVRMLDAGRAEAEGADLIYAVCEYPDDFLRGVLAERPLSPSEARAVLDAALSALAWLHENGLVHGAVDSGHIMAFGDSIKLPSDTILPVGTNLTPADDMRSLGVLLHEVLTREVPRADAHTDFSYLPEPFRSTIRNTVKPESGQPWTVEDIRTHLNPPPPKPEPDPVLELEPVLVGEAGEAGEETPSARESDSRVSENRLAASMQPSPMPSARPPLPPSRPRDDAAADHGLSIKWVPVIGLAAAAALGAVLLRQPEHASSPAAAASTPAVTAPSKTAPAAAPPASKTAPAPAAVASGKPSPLPAQQTRDRAGTPDARPSTAAPVWRVVAYTYNSKSLADKKVRSLNDKRSDWHAELFAPKGEGGPYLVSLGGRMTLAEAQRKQKEAIAKGLPRDTFVRNYPN
jgi:hypothetical protein